MRATLDREDEYRNFSFGRFKRQTSFTPPPPNLILIANKLLYLEFGNVKMA
jgi:hypothetical protein